MTAAVLLLNTKYSHNIAATLRAAAILGATELFWTGSRVPPLDQWPAGERLPREERQGYERYCGLTWLGSNPERPVDLAMDWLVTRALRARGNPDRITPVCVEIRPAAQDAYLYHHPRHALYVFGPEDGDVPKGVRLACHDFVQIPSAYDELRSPLNVSHAVAIMLALRQASVAHVTFPGAWERIPIGP